MASARFLHWKSLVSSWPRSGRILLSFGRRSTRTSLAPPSLRPHQQDHVLLLPASDHLDGIGIVTVRHTRDATRWRTSLRMALVAGRLVPSSAEAIPTTAARLAALRSRPARADTFSATF